VPYLETTGVVGVVWIDPVLRQEYPERDCLQLQEVSTIPSGLLCHPDDSCLLLTLARQLKIAVQESSPTAAHSQPNSVERCASELCEFTGVYRNDHYQRP
jgi:hypothetical protein